MDSVTANLGHQVFGPTLRSTDGRMRSTAEGIVQALVIYTWPPKVSDNTKLAVLAFLTAHGRSTDESPSAWATWVYSYIVLCFPEMQELISRASGREYKFEQLPQGYINAIVDLNNAAGDFSDSQAGEFTKLYTDLQFPPKLPYIPRDMDHIPPELAACASVKVVYGYCSLLIFLAGKQINERNITTISVKRPQNLIDAYKIDEYGAFVLTGDGKLGPESYEQINQVWITYHHARGAIISEVASFASGDTLPQRIIYTIAKMNEYAGMQPAFFIFKFLQARPETREFSCTRAALNAFQMSVREVAAAPGYLQPYYKLIKGDTTRAFHRSSLLILSSCAIALEKSVSPSMRNFDLGEGATAAVNIYDAEAASRGYSTLSSVSSAKHDDTDDIQ